VATGILDSLIQGTSYANVSVVTNEMEVMKNLVEFICDGNAFIV
jgi:hypothetical protein